MRRYKFLRDSFFAFFFMMGIIVFSKIKLHHIFGTNAKFSLLTMFGPCVEAFIGTGLSLVVILGARFLQIIIGISGAPNVFSYIIYLPIFFASHWFGNLVKGMGKENKRSIKYLAVIPLGCMMLFILHPIGREVWYFSLFWLIPIIILMVSNYLEEKLMEREIILVYLYALAATFVDHCVGSVLFLYFLRIPAVYWRIAIPYVPLERAVYALGIAFFYLFIRKSVDALHTIVIIGFIQVQEREEEAIGEWVGGAS